MPHALTEREREVLDFLRDYIAAQGSSPRLEEIARHFGIARPTAHKLLDALHRKGFIYFNRDRVSGFFIRLFEGGRPEHYVEVPIVGEVDRLGCVQQPFPRYMGHFASIVESKDPAMVFALICRADIPPAAILSNDVLVCDASKHVQVGDVVLAMLHPELLVLTRCGAKTLDERRLELESALYFPVPSDVADEQERQLIYWYPLALSSDNELELESIMDRLGIPGAPLPPEMFFAVVVRLTRHLTI